MIEQDNILVIGAGLCGSLLALRLAQRGYTVTVYESSVLPPLASQDMTRLEREKISPT